MAKALWAQLKISPLAGQPHVGEAGADGCINGDALPNSTAITESCGLEGQRAPVCLPKMMSYEDASCTGMAISVVYRVQKTTVGFDSSANLFFVKSFQVARQKRHGRHHSEHCAQS